MNQTTSAGVHCGGFQPTALLLWQVTDQPTPFGISIIKIASIIPGSDARVKQPVKQPVKPPCRCLKQKWAVGSR